MPKKGKVTQGTQQSPDPRKLEGEGIVSAISLTKDGQICVKILAKPGAKQSNVTDISADGVGVQIATPAREGEANEELVRYLAELLNVRKRSISLDKGSKSRQKTVMIDSAEITVEQVRERLSREALED
ncbi:hypothetical protein ACROYT_G001886 [Oculina patagonica]